MSTVVVINCAICGKPVDRIEVRRDESNCSHAVTVWCHGQRDKSALPDWMLAEGDGIHPIVGTAFGTKQVGATA